MSPMMQNYIVKASNDFYEKYKGNERSKQPPAIYFLK